MMLSKMTARTQILAPSILSSVFFGANHHFSPQPPHFITMTSNNETVHISFGNTANYITSHLLNLQGLAATTSSNNDGDDKFGANNNYESSLCDPSVTHDVTSSSSDYYAENTNRSSSSRYMYVPRALIIDGRDSFGTSWGFLVAPGLVNSWKSS